MIDGRSATPWCPTLPRLANARCFARADPLHTPLSLSKQTNNFQSLLSLLLSNLMKKRSLREKRNTIRSRRRRRRQYLETKPPKTTTTGNLDSGIAGRRSVMTAAVESCWQRERRIMTKSSEGEVEELSGDGETKAKNRNSRDFLPQPQKQKKKRKKQKQKAPRWSPFSLLLNSHPPTLLSSHPRVRFLPHSKKTNKKGKRKTQHNTEKTDFSKRKRVFSLDRLTQYQNLK